MIQRILYIGDRLLCQGSQTVGPPEKKKPEKKRRLIYHIIYISSRLARLTASGRCVAVTPNLRKKGGRGELKPLRELRGIDSAFSRLISVQNTISERSLLLLFWCLSYGGLRQTWGNFALLSGDKVDCDTKIKTSMHRMHVVLCFGSRPWETWRLCMASFCSPGCWSK